MSSQQSQAAQHVCNVGFLLLAAALCQHMPPQSCAQQPISTCSGALLALLLPLLVSCWWRTQAEEHPVDVLLHLQCVHLHSGCTTSLPACDARFTVSDRPVTDISTAGQPATEIHQDVFTYLKHSGSTQCTASRKDAQGYSVLLDRHSCKSADSASNRCDPLQSTPGACLREGGLEGGDGARRCRLGARHAVDRQNTARRQRSTRLPGRDMPHGALRPL